MGAASAHHISLSSTRPPALKRTVSKFFAVVSEKSAIAHDTHGEPFPKEDGGHADDSEDFEFEGEFVAVAR